MKIALIALATAISATAALAGEVKPFTGVSDFGSAPIVTATGIYSPSNKTGAIAVPTGSAVSGCTFRRPSTGEIVCEPNSVENLRKDRSDVLPYSNAFGSQSSGQ